MKFMLFVLSAVPGTLEDRRRIGRNNERDQQTLGHSRAVRQPHHSRVPLVSVRTTE